MAKDLVSGTGKMRGRPERGPRAEPSRPETPQEKVFRVRAAVHRKRAALPPADGNTEEAG